MKTLLLSLLCAAAVVLAAAGCGRRTEDPELPVRRIERMPSPDYEEVIPGDELPDGEAPYEMPDTANDYEHINDVYVLAPPDGIAEPDEEYAVAPELDDAAAAEPDPEPEPEEPAADPRAALREMGIEYHKWAFIEAAGEGNVEAVNLFLEAGMEVDEINSPLYGETALIWAARAGQADVVRVLLEAGADVNRRNARDMTALGYALMFKRSGTAAILREAGGER